MPVVKDIEEKVAGTRLRLSERQAALEKARTGDKPEIELELTVIRQELEGLAMELHWMLTDLAGQMRGNMERMEREETTNEPALTCLYCDIKCLDVGDCPQGNFSKTQYQIDAGILNDYQGQMNALDSSTP